MALEKKQGSEKKFYLILLDKFFSLVNHPCSFFTNKKILLLEQNMIINYNTHIGGYNA